MDLNRNNKGKGSGLALILILFVTLIVAYLAVKSTTTLNSASGTVTGTLSETSLIEEFYYPKFGPGQLWKTVANWFTVA